MTIKDYIFTVLRYGSPETTARIKALNYTDALNSLYFPKDNDPAPVITATLRVIIARGVYYSGICFLGTPGYYDKI